MVSGRMDGSLVGRWRPSWVVGRALVPCKLSLFHPSRQIQRELQETTNVRSKTLTAGWRRVRRRRRRRGGTKERPKFLLLQRVGIRSSFIQLKDNTSW